MADIERIIAAQIIARALVNSNRGQQPMGKLAEAARRIKAAKEESEKEADRLIERVDEFQKKAPAAYEIGHTILNKGHADLAEMEAELRQLSNLGELEK